MSDSFPEIIRQENGYDFYANQAADIAADELSRNVSIQDGNRIYVALAEEDLGKLVVGVIQVNEGNDYNSLHVALLAVRRTHQGRGIGSQLINHAIDLTIDAGRTSTSVSPTNQKNRKFYTAHGFIPDRSRDRFWLFRAIDPELDI